MQQEQYICISQLIEMHHHCCSICQTAIVHDLLRAIEGCRYTTREDNKAGHLVAMLSEA